MTALMRHLKWVLLAGQSHQSYTGAMRPLELSMLDGLSDGHILLFCMFCFAIFVLLSDHFSRRTIKEWKKIRAVVTGEIPDEYEFTPYHFKVRYTVNEIEYNTIAYHYVPANRNFRVGDEIDVLVNPCKPSECALTPY